jgi:hypothetical protein
MKIKLKSFLVALSLVLAVLSVISLSGCDHFPADTEQPPVKEDQHTEDNTPTEAPTDDNKPSETEKTNQVQHLIDYPIRLGNKIYLCDEELSKTATAENMGDFLGYDESAGFKSMLEQDWIDVNDEFNVSVFEYIKGDGEKNRVILQYGDNFYVYVFFKYDIDEADKNYPAILLERAVKVGVDDGLLDPSLITDVDYINFADVDDSSGFIKFLADLAAGEKYDSDYMNEYIFGSGKTTKQRRYIRVTLEDKTYFEYEYIPGTSTLTFGGAGGYILTDEQSFELMGLIGTIYGVVDDIDYGVGCNGKIYFAQYKMFDEADIENVGEFLGYVENPEGFERFLYQQNYPYLNFGEVSEVKVYKYVPNESEEELIIIPFGGRFYVFKFEIYAD